MGLDTVLNRKWATASSTAVLIFVIYQLLILFNHEFYDNPLCPVDDKLFASWYWSINYSVCGAFGITWVMLLSKVTRTQKSSLRIPYLTTLCLVTLGFLTTIMALVNNWGGICIDMFGVASPASIWGEWMSCGPLLLFITLTIVGRPALTRNDIIIMLSFFISIVAGMLIVIKQPLWLAGVWLAISCLCYLPMFWLGIIAKNDVRIESFADAGEFESFSELSAKKNNLCAVIIYTMPPFIVVYFLAMAGVIGVEATICGYQLLSVLTKGLFAAAAMDAHLELLNPAARALIEERRANEARRAFLRFIFHEVRTPLNSLTMGIEILEKCDRLDESEVESLLMMRDASTFMSETLNDVLSMQKIEEGKLELEMSFFSIRDATSKVCFTLKGSAVAKGVTVLRLISPDVPDFVYGDKFRVEHVIANILSNAIKFSPVNGQITACVSSRPSTVLLDTVEVTIAVTDQGQGISLENQKKLFSTYMQILPGQMQQGQGSGVGLSLCKQIVTIHGGTISCHSEVGEGSTFSFTIPFKIMIPNNNNNNVLEVENTTHLHIIPVLNLKNIPRSNNTNSKSSNSNSNSNNNSHRIRKEAKEREITEQRYSYDSEGGGGGERLSSAKEMKIESIHSSINSQSRSRTQSQIKDFLQAKNEVTFRGPALVVDDMRSNRKMLNILLSKSGVESEMAEDGVEAVSMVEKDLKRFQMIFMDNMMPRMDGVEAARIIRTLGYEGLIIGITGNVLDDDVKLYLEGGADMVLSKPLKMSQLDMILHHADEHGTKSIPNMKLVESFGRLHWKPLS